MELIHEVAYLAPIARAIYEFLVLENPDKNEHHSI